MFRKVIWCLVCCRNIIQKGITMMNFCLACQGWTCKKKKILPRHLQITSSCGANVKCFPWHPSLMQTERQWLSLVSWALITGSHAGSYLNEAVFIRSWRSALSVWHLTAPLFFQLTCSQHLILFQTAVYTVWSRKFQFRSIILLYKSKLSFCLVFSVSNHFLKALRIMSNLSCEYIHN